ncbi:MAG TPA: ATP synthase F1 subunit delta [Chitinophagaceae bacterium]|nr:ATP synthase F1 subunit delta [Chitinophagaceae bacterium]
MSNVRLATRYAKSLVGLATERGELEKVFGDMEWLQSLCKGNRDFINMLRSPVIKTDTKGKIVKAVAQNNIGLLTNSFIQLLINKGRESALPEITTAFIQQYKEIKKIHSVKLTTAFPVSDELKTSIIDHIKSTTEMQNIELETVVKEEIIGGFVLQTGDKMVDASISYDLKEIARQFENNDFIYKLR